MTRAGLHVKQTSQKSTYVEYRALFGGIMLGSLLLKACKMRGVSLAKACELANIKYSTLHFQISNHRPIPFKTVDQFCRALNLPIHIFSQPNLSITLEQTDPSSDLPELTAAQLSEIAGLNIEIGTDAVLDWLQAHDNHLVNHGWLIERIDLFHLHKPGDTKLRPYRIGKQSLATKFFQLSNVEDYNSVMAGYQQPVVQDIIQSHINAVTMKYMITEEKIDQTIWGTRISGTYRRIIAPVTDTENQKFTLVFSKLTQLARREQMPEI
ncbi:MAG: helix-turn-helix transcriptional regulator [Rhodobacterales bacterium]|nr:helix-turn-helix transcriptional regulator [Rhodobacterales bacterium]